MELGVTTKINKWSRIPGNMIIMQTTEIGIRELKTHLSALLRRVKRGESLTVTDRGTPVARIVPARVSSRDAMAALQEAGLVEWSGEKFSPQEPRAVVKNRRSVSDLLLEDRR